MLLNYDYNVQGEESCTSEFNVVIVNAPDRWKKEKRHKATPLCRIKMHQNAGELPRFQDNISILDYCDDDYTWSKGYDLYYSTLPPHLSNPNCHPEVLFKVVAQKPRELSKKMKMSRNDSRKHRTSWNARDLSGNMEKQKYHLEGIRLGAEMETADETLQMDCDLKLEPAEENK